MPVFSPRLTKQQFYNRYGARFGAPGSGAYNRYVKYVNRRRAAIVARSTPQPVDALAPSTPQQLRVQANALVNSQINPLMKSTIAQSRRQLAQQLAQQNTAANTYSQFVAPIPRDIASIYDAAQRQSDAANAVLTGGMNAATSSAANALSAQQTGVANAPGAFSQAASQFGQSLAQQGAARGAVIGQGVANTGSGNLAFARFLPVIAQAQKLYNRRALTTQSNLALANATDKIRSSIPGMTQQIYNQLLNQEMQKAVARSTFASNMAAITGANQRATAQIQGSMNRAIYNQGQQNQRQIFAANEADARTRFIQGEIDARTQKQIDAANARAAAALKARSGGKAGAAAKMASNIYTKAIQLATAYRTGGSNAGSDVLAALGGGFAPPGTTRITNPNKAMSAISAYIRHYYPNASNLWVYTYALSVLSVAGYTGPNIRLYQSGNYPPSGYPRPPGGGTQQPKTGPGRPG